MNARIELHVARRGAALVLAIGAASCSRKPPVHEPTVPVRLGEVTRISAPVTIESNGVVEALETVSVEAQVSGSLTDVSFHEGDDVEAGQVLFRIDARPFAAALRQAQATLARDQAQAVSAGKDAERYRTLAAKDYVTRSAADQAAATAAALNATLQSDSAAVENAQVNLGYCTIRSPISGRTGSLLVRQGNLVKQNGEPLVVINQIHPINVRFPVTQRDFLTLSQRAATGNVPVSVITADSVPVAEAGALSFIDNAVDSLTGTVSAKARFANQSRKLWPGEFVRVSAQLEVQSNVLAVPTAAILSGQNGPYVFVLDSAREAQMQPVKIGRAVGELTLVENGLKDRQQVVVDGQSRLTPGAKVDVQKAAPAAATDGRGS